MARGKTAKKGKGSKGLNQKESDSFLKKNSEKEKIITLPSGLQYEIVTEGEGKTPSEESLLTVHQRITLVDGTIVADSYRQNSPEEFLFAEAIEGYREGLLLMREGGRYKFYIPPHLAWGKRGAGKKIGPFSIVIIDCKLLTTT